MWAFFIEKTPFAACSPIDQSTDKFNFTKALTCKPT